MFLDKQTESLIESINLCENSSWMRREYQSLTETQKEKIVDRTVTNLFKSIKSKAFDLDFSDVQKGKGDITQINNYADLKNAINFLDKMSKDIKEQDVLNAIMNIKMVHNSLLTNKKLYMEGFKLNNQLIIYLFNSISVALVQSASYVISKCVEIVKESTNTYHCEMKNNKIGKHSSLSALQSYNEMEKNGKLIACMKNTIKLEGPVTVTMTVIGGILLALLTIRWAVFIYYYTRVSLSQYFEHLREFVLMNASTLGDDQKEVRKKQEKTAEKLRKLSEKLAVDQKVANDRAKDDIKRNDKEIADTNKEDNEIF